MFRLNFNEHKKQEENFASVVCAQQLARKLACNDEAEDGARVQPRHNKQGLRLR